MGGLHGRVICLILSLLDQSVSLEQPYLNFSTGFKLLKVLCKGVRSYRWESARQSVFKQCLFGWYWNRWKTSFPLLHHSPFFPLLYIFLFVNNRQQCLSIDLFWYNKMISFLLRSQWENNINTWTHSAVFETTLHLCLSSIGFLKSEANQPTGRGHHCGYMELLPSSCTSPVKLRQCFFSWGTVWDTKSFGKRFRSTFSPSIALVSTWQYFIPSVLFGLWNCSYSTEDKFFVI